MKKRPSGGFAGGCFTIFSDCRGRAPGHMRGWGDSIAAAGPVRGEPACRRCPADIGGVELFRLPGGKGFLFDAGGGVHLGLSLLLRESGGRLPWNRTSRAVRPSARPPGCPVIWLSGSPGKDRRAGPFRRRVKSGERMKIRSPLQPVKEVAERRLFWYNG